MSRQLDFKKYKEQEKKVNNKKDLYKIWLIKIEEVKTKMNSRENKEGERLISQDLDYSNLIALKIVTANTMSSYEHSYFIIIN